MDPKIHQTNPEPLGNYPPHNNSYEQRERLSNKSGINGQNGHNGELKSKRSSIKNNSQTNSRQGAPRARGPVQNIPLSFMKTLNNPHTNNPNNRVSPKAGTRQNTGRAAGNHNVISITSKKSNLTSFTNNTLSSALSPNCNISYSTLKSTNSNTKSNNNSNKSKKQSLKTSNTRKTDKSSVNNKFPMNSNFLNLLKKKNLENNGQAANVDPNRAGMVGSGTNYSIDNQKLQCSSKNSKETYDEIQQKMSSSGCNFENNQNIGNKLKQKTSKVVQIYYNNNANNTNVVQINNYMNNIDKNGHHNRESSEKTSVQQSANHNSVHGTKSTRKSISNSNKQHSNKNVTPIITPQFYNPKDRMTEKYDNIGMPIMAGKIGTSSNQNLHDKEKQMQDKERQSQKSSNTSGLKPFPTQVNINLLNNINGLIPNQPCTQNISSQQNSMLQSKKISKKKDIELSANNTAICTSSGIPVNMPQGSSKMPPRKNVNPKVTLQKQAVQVAQNYWNHR